MSGTINIDLDKVADYSVKFSKREQNMSATLSQFAAILLSTSSSWESQAGDIFRSNGQTFSQSFELLYDKVQSWSSFLRETVTAYTECENRVDALAHDFEKVDIS